MGPLTWTSITGTAFEVRDRGRCLNSSSLAMKKEKTQADTRSSLCITSVRLIQFLAVDLPGVRVIRRHPFGKVIPVPGLSLGVGVARGRLATSLVSSLSAARFVAALPFVTGPVLSCSIRGKRIPSWNRRSSSSSSVGSDMEAKTLCLLKYLAWV